jgi:hypothetical protein
MPTQDEIQVAAEAIAKGVGKRTMVLEHDYKYAKAALEAAEKVRRGDPLTTVRESIERLRNA